MIVLLTGDDSDNDLPMEFIFRNASRPIRRASTANLFRAIYGIDGMIMMMMRMMMSGLSLYRILILNNIYVHNRKLSQKPQTEKDILHIIIICFERNA